MPPVPGLELAKWIAANANAGRRAWQIGPIPGLPFQLFAPRPPVRYRGGELLPSAAPLEGMLPRRLAIALETMHPLAFEELRDQDLAAGKRLHAAALRDVVGLSEEEVADACGFAGANATRTAREAVSAARPIWRAMAAWPWLEMEGGKPPADWRKTPFEPRFARSLQSWATGTLA